jgi:hypothetical protein
MSEDPSIFGPGYVPQDIPGPQGPPGPANTLAIGTVTEGINVAATITGASPSQVLNLIIPRGNPGPQGLPGGNVSLAIGSVTSGSPASASITGASPNQVLNLVLPKGDTGNTGPAGPAATFHGASFGFAEGYLAGTSLAAGTDLVWSVVKMDPDDTFPGLPALPTSDIPIPAAWNNVWMQVTVGVSIHEDGVAIDTTQVAPVSTKIVLTHKRGAVLTKWRVSAHDAYTLGGKCLISTPILMLAGDLVSVRLYSDDAGNSIGLSASSHLTILPVGLGV